MAELEERITAWRAEQALPEPARLEKVLGRKLKFHGSMAFSLAATQLDRAVVLEGSNHQTLEIMLYLKSGQQVPIHLSRCPLSFSIDFHNLRMVPLF